MRFFFFLSFLFYHSITPEQTDRQDRHLLMQNLGIKKQNNKKKKKKKKQNAVYLVIQIRYMCCVSQKAERKKILSLKQLDKSKNHPPGIAIANWKRNMLL